MTFDSKIDNARRAEQAGTAIIAFGEETGADWNESGACEAFRDLLVNLHHWADLRGVDMLRELRFAEQRFEVEKREDA